VKVKAYKIEPKTLRALVEWAGAGVDSMVDREHCSAKDRALIRGFARDLGLLPPDSVYRSIQAGGRAIPDKETQHHIVRERLLQNAQIELTAKLASEPTLDEIRRREIAIYGRQAEAQTIP
jgi:hypothetical protein